MYIPSNILKVLKGLGGWMYFKIIRVWTSWKLDIQHGAVKVHSILDYYKM